MNQGRKDWRQRERGDAGKDKGKWIRAKSQSGWVCQQHLSKYPSLGRRPESTLHASNVQGDNEVLRVF